MDNISINIEQLPKQFAENIVVGSNNQMFMLVVMVGANATAFTITPEHAKNLAKALSEHVKKFEKDVRSLPEGVPSPLQRSELASSGKDNPKK